MSRVTRLEGGNYFERDPGIDVTEYPTPDRATDPDDRGSRPHWRLDSPRPSGPPQPVPRPVPFRTRSLEYARGRGFFATGRSHHILSHLPIPDPPERGSAWFARLIERATPDH